MTSKKKDRDTMSFPDPGAQVRAWRIHCGLTQAELQDRAGLAHNAVSRIETGEVSPRLDTLERLATVMQITIEELQFRSPPKPIEVKTDTDLARLIERVEALPDDKRDGLIVTLTTMLDLLEKS